MRKSDFTLPTLDDLFFTQAERDDAKLERVRNIPLRRWQGRCRTAVTS